MPQCNIVLHQNKQTNEQKEVLFEQVYSKALILSLALKYKLKHKLQANFFFDKGINLQMT